MQGLLMKDLRLLWKNKNNFLLILLIALTILIIGNDATFFISYMSMISLLIMNSTLSYDEFDNGMPLILSLPVTRKNYVQSKYILLISTLFLSLLFNFSVCYIVLIMIKNTAITPSDLLSNIFGVACGVLIIASLLLPIHLKFGTRKAVIITMLVGGGFTLLGALLVLLVKNTQIFSGLKPEHFSAFQPLFDSEWKIISIIVLVLLLILWISYQSSLKVIRNKEY